MKVFRIERLNKTEVFVLAKDIDEAFRWAMMPDPEYPNRKPVVRTIAEAIDYVWVASEDLDGVVK